MINLEKKKAQVKYLIQVWNTKCKSLQDENSQTMAMQILKSIQNQF